MVLGESLDRLAGVQQLLNSTDNLCLQIQEHTHIYTGGENHPLMHTSTCCDEMPFTAHT